MFFIVMNSQLCLCGPWTEVQFISFVVFVLQCTELSADSQV